MSNLDFYTNGADIVIAESPADAAKVWEERTGDSWTEDYESYEGPFECLDYGPGRIIQLVWVDDDPQLNEVPTGGRIQMDTDTKRPAVSATVKQWIDFLGRTFFSSPEW